MFKYTITSGAVVVVLAVAGASSAAACGAGVTVDQKGVRHDLDIGVSGPCNDLHAVQRNGNNSARISIEGRGTASEVYQLGRNGALDMRVRGSLAGGIVVVQGHCSPGSATRHIEYRTNGMVDVHVPKCR